MVSASSYQFARISLGLALAVLLGACQSDGGSGSGGAPEVKVNPKSVQAKAKTPPPATAKTATSIGKGKATINVANKPGDTDSFWVERLDIDGDGDIEETQLLWDDEDKVLFAYAEVDVVTDDGAATVQMLVGVNGEGNPRGRPAGSGFFAVYFDAGEGGAEVAGLYGCRFDAKGKVTEWAAVAVDGAGDTIVAAG
jgi:hypothetical protein